jgi:hypothetical protein
MWLHHDASWWALILAILALLLMLPVNLLANFMTPLLKDWWAGRSVNALTERISRLQSNLSALEKSSVLTETESTLFRGMESITKLIWNVGYFILAFLWIVADALIPQIAHAHHEAFWGLMVFIGMIGYEYITAYRTIKNYRVRHSLKFRTKLRATINELERKLRAKRSE